MALILGIESSCDESAAAIVDTAAPDLAHRIVAQHIASQDEMHRPFGGVVPEIAARAHVERLAPLIAATLADAGLTLADMDAIAATAGPGLIGGVMVGLVTAKALAMAGDKPLLAVNHLEGHALSPRLADPTLDFPYALLLVSGRALPVAGSARSRRLPAAGHHHRRRAGRGVRQNRQAASGWAIRAARQSSGWRARGTRGRCLCRGRCWDRAIRISRSPG